MAERKTYRVVVSARARQMLGEHIRFLAKVNKDAAREKKKQILSELRSLTYMPERYPFLQVDYLPVNRYRKMFIENWYLVLYQVQGEIVHIEYILDGRQEWQGMVDA